MVAARVTVLSVVLTGLGTAATAAAGSGAAGALGEARATGLGLAATAVPGEAPSPLRAGDAGQARGNATGEAGDGGRDPFARPSAPASPGPVEVRAPGLAGVTVDEAVLLGVVTSREGRLAVLEGPGGRAWVVRPGERLRDGTVQGVAADAVVFLRDAAASVRLADRRVRKPLGGTGSAR